MQHEQAMYLRDLIHKNKFQNLCELGHFHGKSSVYMGAILEEQEVGKLTTFDQFIRVRPSIYDLVSEFSLENYVNPVVSVEGYSWDLANLIKSDAEKFDFCYIDGCHTFDSTLIAFVLTNVLLKSGGIIIFDDLNWTVNNSIAGPAILLVPAYRQCTELQKTIPQVKMVCDLIVPHYDYTLLEVIDKWGWAVFRKN